MNKTQSILLKQLRPTQMTVGTLQVKHKRKCIRKLAGRPSELVAFILEHPIRVVMGPGRKAYVIDHHHLALALIKERYETAPMQVEKDFSGYGTKEFLKKMLAEGFVHPFDSAGKKRPLSSIPKSLEKMADDPYRSLAGFVRAYGGFLKVAKPFAEFQWADYYRGLIKPEIIQKKFGRAIEKAMKLAHHKDAAKLPGYIGPKETQQK